MNNSFTRQQLTRFKKSFESEGAAKKSICEKLQITDPTILVADHTNGTWRWKLADAPQAKPEAENIYKVEKTEGMTDLLARDKAVEHLKTFEGNLKKEHTETHYVFIKIRG